MNSDEEDVMLVCNPRDAADLVDIQGKEILPVLIMCEALPSGSIFIVKKDDFINFVSKGDLYEKSRK